MTTVNDVLEKAKSLGRLQERLRWKRVLLDMMDELGGEDDVATIKVD